jgi:hypothetical protein
MADARRLVELSMVPPLAKEVASQINGGVAAKTQVTALTPLTGAFGSTSSAIVDVGASFSQTTLNNNFRALEDKINVVIAALKA